MDNRIGSAKPSSNTRRHPTSTAGFKPYAYRGTGKDTLTGPTDPMEDSTTHHASCRCPECTRRKRRAQLAQERRAKGQAQK